MAESASDIVAQEDTPKAVKDKNCPYCGQAFTSSSLGRHLDLYIKERNPKRPDGIHNVEEIRKLRGNVTRRQPKGASGRRQTSTPAGTPLAVSKKDSVSDAESPAAPSPGGDSGSPTKGMGCDLSQLYALPWEATGVMNEIPAKSLEDGSGGAVGEEIRSGADMDSLPAGHDSGRRMAASRAVSRQAVKVHLDMKQKLQDAMDNARAAELALREFMGSWRAAKQQIDLESMPFDFDPLSMNFPALTLHCLRPTATLFASTQLPTPSSWSTTPPGEGQCIALKAFFKEEFRKWKVACAVATTAVYEDLPYPPSSDFKHKNQREYIERAEQRVEKLQHEATDHLEAAFAAWDVLPAERKNELWVLELARGVATKQTEASKLRDTQHTLKQEITNLKSQIDHLNRLQQPREYKIMPPITFPVGEDIVMHLTDEAITHGRRSVGMNISDRHADLGTVVASAIGRWRNVITSARTSNSGMSAQRPLGGTPSRSPTTPAPLQTATLAPPSASTGPPTPSVGSPRQARQSHPAPSRPAGPVPPATPSVPTAPMETTAPLPQAELERMQQRQPPAPLLTNANSSADDNMSDKDADAEMEDGDEFAHMHTPISHALQSTVAPVAPLVVAPPPPPVPQQMMSQLKVARMRGPAQQALPTVVGVPNVLGGAGQITASRSMPDINEAMHMHTAGHHMLQQADMSLAMQTFGRDSMYMD